ncbi:hypothetical protein SSS_08260 [Sarcoptes scabiei]|uniref:Uncharacterized protein n=1 Tax=Sarcoptes scabiei TaxID=52283 RepID=A0A834R6J7_SARSC|nr:hypothetical protein SSS_08260 [Sarcoptes scabiei]
MSMIDFEDDQFITIESIVIVFSALLFTLINRLLFCLQSRLRSDHKLLDDRIALESYRIWKWRNIVVSLIHSTISGIISLYLSFENNHLRLSGSSKMSQAESSRSEEMHLFFDRIFSLRFIVVHCQLSKISRSFGDNHTSSHHNHNVGPNILSNYKSSFSETNRLLFVWISDRDQQYIHTHPIVGLYFRFLV